jgi:methyl-accepting chemotaxis protein
MNLATPSRTRSSAGRDAIVDWLAAIQERRDFTLSAPALDGDLGALQTLLDTLSTEFGDLAAVVAGARDAARRNADNLRNVVRAANEQDATARTSAEASAQAGEGATRMADAIVDLRGLVETAAASASAADTNLRLIDATLAQLAQRLSDGDAPIGRMARASAGITEFVATLARLSRHAQLLAVNASIEAAHLGDAGARFAIVADQVRRLSTSTRESKADVGTIVVELRGSGTLIAAAVGDSNAATAAAAGEITASAQALARTGDDFRDFAAMVATVAESTDVQRTAFAAIDAAIAQSAHHAGEAAGASRAAGELDLDSLLERAASTASRWRLRSASHAPRYDHVGSFGAWIEAICSGSDASAGAEVDRDPDLVPFVAAVRSLVERVNGEMRELLGDIIAVAVAVSRNSYAWRSIAASHDGVARETRVVREAVGTSVDGARNSLQLADRMMALLRSVRSQYDVVLDLLGGALERIARIGGTVETIDAAVDAMSAAAERADRIMALIETLASETDLLSLNAAIEAAHAGELGLGFSVIAEEIRSLARSTNEATSNVSQLVGQIATSSTELQTTIAGAAAGMSDVVSGAQSTQTAIAALRSAFASAEERALDVATIAAEQARRLDRVTEAVNRSAAAMESNAASATDRGRLELAGLGARAHDVAARRPIGSVAQRVRDLAHRLCVRLEAAIESTIVARRIPRERLFAPGYREIAGADIASLARLFDVSRVPAEGFEPAKYATPWDASVDEAMIDVLTAGWEEATAADISPVAMFVSDLNGLFYAYPRQKIAAWTNDPAKDLLGNRIKRLFEDEYALRVGRVGLGPNAEHIGPRAPYDAFRDAGCVLARAEPRPWGGYVYARDTSLVCNEIVMALYVGDLRHSTLRVCYDPSLI